MAKQLTELIGNTPLLELSNYEKENELKAKLETDKYITNWNENGNSVEEVSKFVRMQSAYDGVIVNGRDYI